MMNEEENISQDDGSVWTSYSDLFTNVAIIFLVMFVFAMIKSGMNQIQTAQVQRKHEAELKGKLSQQEVAQSKERIAKVEQTVNDMKNYEDVIDKKVQELNDYAKKLQENKMVLKEIIDSQSKQDSLMKMAQAKLEEEQKQRLEKQAALEEAELRINMLNDELTRAQAEVKQREDILQKQIAERNQVVSEKEVEFQKTVKELTTKLAVAQSEATQLQTELKNEEASRSQEAKLAAQFKEQLQALEASLQATQAQKMKLEQERLGLSGNLKNLEAQNSQLKKDFEGLNRKLASTQGISSELESKLNALNARMANAESEAGKWKGAFEGKLKDAERLQGELAGSQARFNKLAGTMSALRNSVKNDVANKLGSKFKEHGLDAHVNAQTGEVVLLSGEGFNFEKGSTKLSKEAKEILKKVVPLYAEVLFSDDKITAQITSISLEGHSSPSFSGKFVNPDDNQIEAYSFNLKLSGMRAASVAQYMMGKEIGEYPHKAKLKALLQTVGFGYMKPVLLENPIVRGPASAQPVNQECGPWDCHKSQRVQMNFLLKDNIEEIRKIIESNGSAR